MALAWGVLIGGILQLAFQIPFLRKIKKLPKLQFGHHKTIDTLKKRMLPALFGVSVSQINLLVDTMIASTLIAGSVSWLYYSDRLLELPLALIGIALATVALAKLSNYHAHKDTSNFIKTINKALLISLILGFPACLGLILYSKELIITLFQYGEFSVDSAIKTSLSLQAYGSGLMAFIAIKIFAPVFLSRGDTKTPVKAGIVAMVSNIILNLILVQFYGHIGLAAATSLSALLNASILYFYLIKQSIFKFDAAFYKMLTRVIFAVILMSSYILFFDTNIEAYFDSSIFDRCWLLFKSIAISASIYFLSLFVIGVRFKDL
jgi:putative peptidoglycan lipid II flippase